jgi:N-acetylmuramoyl-L-alanine amidase
MSEAYTVQSGDCMTSIAARFGFGKFQTIYNHPDNSQFKQDHPNPDVLTTGSVIQIPDKATKKETKQTNASHKFKVTRPKAKLKLELKDDQGQALANKKFRLVVGNTNLEGTTDGSGKIDQDIPPDRSHGELTVWMDESNPSAQVITFPLELGGLEPHTTVNGAQQRLQNLGFDCGGVSGAMNAETEAAVRAFQQKNSLTVNGTLDTNTQNKLKDLHKS